MIESCQSEKTTTTIDATTPQESASSTCQTSEGMPEALDRFRESFEYLAAWGVLLLCAAVFVFAAFGKTRAQK